MIIIFFILFALCFFLLCNQLFILLIVTVSKKIKLFTGDNVAFILVKVNRHNAYFLKINMPFLAVFRHPGFSVITTGTF